MKTIEKPKARRMTHYYVARNQVRNMNAAVDFYLRTGEREIAVNRMRFRILGEDCGIVSVVPLRYERWLTSGGIVEKWGYNNSKIYTDTIEQYKIA